MDQELGQASRFVMVSIDGVDWQVPADTSLLNCFQYLQAYAISMGGFCWNDDCHTCEVLVQKGSGISERVLACQTQGYGKHDGVGDDRQVEVLSSWLDGESLSTPVNRSEDVCGRGRGDRTGQPETGTLPTGEPARVAVRNRSDGPA